MNNIKSKEILGVLAIFVLVSQASAFSSGFGGSGTGGLVGSSNTMSLGLNDFFSTHQTLSLQPGVSSLSSSTLATLSGDSWANQYHAADSGDGKNHVATYAYMDKPTTYSYSFHPSTTSTSASISEDLTATNASNLLYGGFAYNLKDYAAVKIVGKSDSITYHNDLYADSSKVSAHQTFFGTGCNLTAYSWAERGNLRNESKNQLAIDSTWNNIKGLPGRSPGGDVSNATFALRAGQRAIFGNASINFFGSLASLKSDTATTNESVNVSSADHVEFHGMALKGIYSINSGNKSRTDDSGAKNDATIDGGKNIVYSAKTTSTSTQQSANQNLNVSSNSTISLHIGAGYSKASMDPDNQTFTDSSYGVDQNASLQNATIGKKGYQGSSSISSTTATASQSDNITSADSVLFNGIAGNGNNRNVGNIHNGEGIRALTTVQSDNSGPVRWISYSAKSTSASSKTIGTSSVSATQTLNAKSGGETSTSAQAGYNKDTNYDVVNYTGAGSSYSATQSADLYNFSTGKNGLKSSASISGTTSTSSQSADVSSADSASFYNGAVTGKYSSNAIGGNIYNAEDLYALTDAYVEGAWDYINGGYLSPATGITYSATNTVTNASKISTSSASATQTLNAKSKGFVNTEALARYYKDTNYDWVNNTGATIGYSAGQSADLCNFSTGKNGLKSSASISGTTSTSSQSADVSSADSASFGGSVGGDKWTKVGNKTTEESNSAYTSASLGGLKAITYSASSSNISKALSASQTISGSGKHVDSVNTYSNAGWNKYIDDPDKNSESGSSYGAGQNANLGNVTIGKKGLQSSASLSSGTSSGTATASQTEDITSADSAKFNVDLLAPVSPSYGQGGYGNTGYNVYNDVGNYTIGYKNNEDSANVNAGATVNNGKTITYSGKSTSTINSLSATQALSVTSANYTARDAFASRHKSNESASANGENYSSGNRWYGAFANASANSYYPPSSPTKPILASMSGTDTVSVDAKKATATQNVNAKGINITRNIGAGQTVHNNTYSGDLFLVGASTSIFNAIPAAKSVNSLVGQSTATINANTSASLSGSWIAIIAKELGTYSPNFNRTLTASNAEGDYANVHVNKATKASAKSISFTESASATKSDASAT